MEIIFAIYIKNIEQKNRERYVTALVTKTATPNRTVNSNTH